MPKFLNDITENNNPVTTSNNDTIDNVEYVTRNQYNNLIANNQLVPGTIYHIDDSFTGRNR